MSSMIIVSFHFLVMIVIFFRRMMMDVIRLTIRIILLFASSTKSLQVLSPYLFADY